MIRRLFIGAVAALLTLVQGPARASDLEPGVWRGTIAAQNPRAKVSTFETKAALHIGPAGNLLFLEDGGVSLPIVEISTNRDGSFNLASAGSPLIELRGLRTDRNGFEAKVYVEIELSAPLAGEASFERVRPLRAPSFRGDCKSAPVSLGSLCGVWSGISLRGQPKLLIIDKITRNRQKVAWELKAKQNWGGGGDLASAGMSFPYTEYVPDEVLPLSILPLRTTGRLSYRFEVRGDELVGGHIADPGDATTYVRVVK